MSDVRMFLKFALCVFKTALEIRLNELIYYAYYVVDAHFLHSFTKGVLGTVQFLLYVRRPHVLLKCNKFALCVFNTALEILLNELINMHTTCSGGCSFFALVY